jgi:hypothetical protein
MHAKFPRAAASGLRVPTKSPSKFVTSTSSPRPRFHPRSDKTRLSYATFRLNPIVEIYRRCNIARTKGIPWKATVGRNLTTNPVNSAVEGAVRLYLRRRTESQPRQSGSPSSHCAADAAMSIAKRASRTFGRSACLQIGVWT